MPDPKPVVQPRPAGWISHRERGSIRLMRLMVLLSLRLGRRLSRCAVYGIALYFFLCAPDTRRHSLRYLRLALGRRPNARDRFRHLLYFATCTHDRVYLIDAQYECFQITIEGEPFVRAQLDAGNGGVPDGRAHGQFRSDAQRRAPPARAPRVDGYVRAQCAQDQRRSGRDQSRGRRPTSLRSARSTPCCRSPNVWIAALSSACSAIERSAMSPCSR